MVVGGEAVRRPSRPFRGSIIGALGRTLNVQGVRLACGRRAPPRIWTFLSSLRVFPRSFPAPPSSDISPVRPADDSGGEGETLTRGGQEIGRVRPAVRE